MSLLISYIKIINLSMNSILSNLSTTYFVWFVSYLISCRKRRSKQCSPFFQNSPNIKLTPVGVTVFLVLLNWKILVSLKFLKKLNITSLVLPSMTLIPSEIWFYNLTNFSKKLMTFITKLKINNTHNVKLFYTLTRLLLI